MILPPTVFGLLCVRLVTACLQQDGSTPFFILFLGISGLGFAYPAPTLFALTVCMPLLGGLHMSTLLPIPSPIDFAFASFFLGRSIRRLTRFRPAHTGYFMPVETARAPAKAWMKLLLDAVGTGFAISCTQQLIRHSADAGFREAFLGGGVFGFGDPFYFFTAAFVGLQGIIFCRCLLADGETTAKLIHAIFPVYLVTTIIFLCIQYVFRIPYTEPDAPFVYFSPYVDKQDIGSFSVVLFVWYLASLRIKTISHLATNTLAAFLALALVIVSWTRATWASAIIGVAVLTVTRLPRTILLLLIALGLGIWVTGNHYADNDTWNANPYRWRLGRLTRIESIPEKIPGRWNLYHKAIQMIREDPWFGHGIGSFYLTSVKYATAGDPEANLPNFAHSTLLQYAAELGLPVTLVFVAIAFLALCQIQRPHNSSLPVFSRTHLAYIGFLFTQVTSNSLNIYSDCQFLFWLLTAALLTADGQPDLLSTQRIDASRSAGSASPGREDRDVMKHTGPASSSLKPRRR